MRQSWLRFKVAFVSLSQDMSLSYPDGRSNSEKHVLVKMSRLNTMQQCIVMLHQMVKEAQQGTRCPSHLLPAPTDDTNDDSRHPQAASANVPVLPQAASRGSSPEPRSKKKAMMILFQNARGLQRAHRTCQCGILIVMPMFSPTLMDMHIFGFLIGIHVFTFWRDHRIHQRINQGRREPYDGKVIILVQSKDIMCMRILRIVQHGI